jgi:hypothetical protein
MSRSFLNRLSVFAERDFCQACENRDAEDDVQKRARLHRNDVEGRQGDIHRCQQRERPRNVTVHSPASRGISKTGHAHHQERG